MTADAPSSRAAVRRASRRWLWSLATLPLGLAAACWWFTEPLEPLATTAPAATLPAEPADLPPAAPPKLAWPEGRLEGEAAKQLLLPLLVDVRARLQAIDGYTAVLRKQERLRGKLGDEQTLEMKVRHRPFSIYFKFRDPEPGKEVVYCEGEYDGHVIAHGTGIARRLIPRLKVPPDSPIALMDSRHPVTEAGLLNLVNKLVGFRELDLIDPHAATVLDRTTDSEGRAWLRSLHTHPHQKPERPFARVEVLYDPETFFPLRITSYDWPGPDHEGDLLLAERYAYDDLNLDVSLSDIDFDPANPDYDFTRY